VVHKLFLSVPDWWVREESRRYRSENQLVVVDPPRCYTSCCVDWSLEIVYLLMCLWRDHGIVGNVSVVWLLWRKGFFVVPILKTARFNRSEVFSLAREGGDERWSIFVAVNDWLFRVPAKDVVYFENLDLVCCFIKSWDDFVGLFRDPFSLWIILLGWIEVWLGICLRIRIGFLFTAYSVFDTFVDVCVWESSFVEIMYLVVFRVDFVQFVGWS